MPGVYISYPFCAQKCSFCNFASGPAPPDVERDYVDALLAEAGSHHWEWLPQTLYLGGGTPSRMPEQALRELLARIPGRPWVEATIEAAHGSVTGERAKLWPALGINRVSLGVQSFVSKELAGTGRRHTPEMVEGEISLLRQAGIRKINIDLIVGLPHQTLESWQRSLEWVERLQVDHVSVYMLEVDEDSRLGRQLLNGGSRYGARDAPPEELVVQLYKVAVERLHAMGLKRYEISNFARPGQESLHNLKYWRLEPYVGFGADAHSFDGRVRRRNAESPSEYIARWRAGRPVCVESRPADTAEERFFVGLRLSEGIRPTPEEWRRHETAIRRGVEEGLLDSSGGILRLTERGVLWSNEVFQEFVSV